MSHIQELGLMTAKPDVTAEALSALSVSPDSAPDSPTAATNPETITILSEQAGKRMTKQHTWSPERGEWITNPYDNGFLYRTAEVAVAGVDDIYKALKSAAGFSHYVVIRGVPTEETRRVNRENGSTRRLLTKTNPSGTFDEVPRRWAMIDVDNVTLPGFDIRTQATAMVAELIRVHFPGEFQGVRCVWQLSASAGVAAPERAKVHLWFWLSRPLSTPELKAWNAAADFPADISVFGGVQPHYVADPVFVGGEDPCQLRWGILDGEKDAVAVPAIDLNQPTKSASKSGAPPGRLGHYAGFEEALAAIGDGEGQGGFHGPINAAIWAYLRDRPAAHYDKESLKAEIRVKARAAFRAPGRSVGAVEAYLTDARLDADIRSVITKQKLALIRRVSAQEDFAPALPLSEAEAAVAQAVGEFYRHAGVSVPPQSAKVSGVSFADESSEGWD